MSENAEFGQESRFVEVAMTDDHSHLNIIPISGDDDLVDGSIARIERIGSTEPAMARHYTIEETDTAGLG